MSQISTPSMPIRLYRYRSLHSKDNGKLSDEKLQRELRAIRENHLWFHGFDDLNDPMEGIFGMRPAAANASRGKLVSEEVRSVMRQIGVCCFSDTYENDVMWAHYAMDFRGICVKYSSHDLRDGLPKATFVRMQYDIRIPNLGVDVTNELENAAITALSSKKVDWSYEREWRLLTASEAIGVPGKMEIQGQSPVKAIYFGCRTEQRVIDAFKKDLKGVRGDTIQFFRPTSIDKKYEYGWEKA